MTTVTHETWWATREAQATREGFMAAHRAQLERMTTTNSPGAAIDSLVRLQFSMGMKGAGKATMGLHVAWSAR
jgi:hypothetical protein